MPVFDLKHVGNGLPEGNYIMMLTKVTPKVSRTQKEMLLLEMTVADEEKSEFNGQKAWRNITLEETTMPFIKQALVAFECDPEIFETGVDPAVELPKLIGNKALVTIGPATPGGPSATEVKKLAPVPFE